MRSLLPLAALALVVGPLPSGHASPSSKRNWIDRYIAAHGHCTQQPTVLVTEPLDKPIEEWTDGDLDDLKAALDRCDALPEVESGVSRRWTSSYYENLANLVHEQQRRAARQ